jgi:hypothetical protein
LAWEPACSRVRRPGAFPGSSRLPRCFKCGGGVKPFHPFLRFPAVSVRRHAGYAGSASHPFRAGPVEAIADPSHSVAGVPDGPRCKAFRPPFEDFARAWNRRRGAAVPLHRPPPRPGVLSHSGVAFGRQGRVAHISTALAREPAASMARPAMPSLSSSDLISSSLRAMRGAPRCRESPMSRPRRRRLGRSRKPSGSRACGVGLHRVFTRHRGLWASVDAPSPEGSARARAASARSGRSGGSRR